MMKQLPIAVSTAALAACATTPAQPAASLVISVEMHATGLNAGLNTPLGALADRFDTGRARVLRGQADEDLGAPKNAVTSQLSESATARVLELVTALTREPESPDNAPCIVRKSPQDEVIIVVGDGSALTVDLSIGGHTTRYKRYEPFYDKIAKIAALVAGFPDPTDGRCGPIETSDFSTTGRSAS